MRNGFGDWKHTPHKRRFKKQPEAYSEHWKPLTIFAKRSILDVWQDSETPLASIVWLLLENYRLLFWYSRTICTSRCLNDVSKLTNGQKKREILKTIATF